MTAAAAGYDYNNLMLKLAAGSCQLFMLKLLQSLEAQSFVQLLAGFVPSLPH